LTIDTVTMTQNSQEVFKLLILK